MGKLEKILEDIHKELYYTNAWIEELRLGKDNSLKKIGLILSCYEEVFNKFLFIDGVKNLDLTDTEWHIILHEKISCISRINYYARKNFRYARRCR